MNKVCWCGKEALRYRAACCAEHGISARSERARRRVRLCYCGAQALPKRATCSDACAAARHGVRGPVRLKRLCAGCDRVLSPGGTNTHCRGCKQKRDGRRCACGALALKGRSTCSLACAKAASPCPGVRSDSRRAKRRKEARTQYRRPDKDAVIARLTLEQGGLCIVCGSEGHALGDGRTGLVLDHCHHTGQARAMLCGRCNAALGMMREDPVTIEALRCYAEACASLRE